MDPLTQLLMQRAQQPAAPSPPFSPPPNVHPHLPSPTDRWLTAQKMISGYQQNWTPNPTITRITNPS